MKTRGFEANRILKKKKETLPFLFFLKIRLASKPRVFTTGYGTGYVRAMYGLCTGYVRAMCTTWFFPAQAAPAPSRPTTVPFRPTGWVVENVPTLLEQGRARREASTIPIVGSRADTLFPLRNELAPGTGACEKKRADAFCGRIAFGSLCHPPK